MGPRGVCLPGFSMRSPLRDAETASLLIPNRYALLTDLADHATGFVLTPAYGGREIVPLHRRETEEMLPGWFGRWRVVVRMIPRHIASIFRYMEDACLLKPGKRGVNIRSAGKKGGGRTLWGGYPVGEGFVAWSGKGSQAKHEGESREYKAHGLTTISGCVMMGMGGREQRRRKPNLNELHML